MEAIDKKLIAASKHRNLVVHSAYGIEHKGGNIRPILHPSYFDATAISRRKVKDNKLLPEHVIDLHRLIDFEHEFSALAKDLRAFRDGHPMHLLVDRDD